MDDETLQNLVNELELYFTPLIVSAEQPDLLYDFFSSMGWHLAGHLGSEEENLFSHIAVIVGVVEDTIEIVNNLSEDDSQILALVQKLQPLINTIRRLPSTLSGLSVPELSQLPADLFLYLTALYIFNKSPFLFRLLELLTIIRQPEPSILVRNGSILRLYENSPSLELDRIADLLTNPGEVFHSIYWPEGFTDLETTNAVAKRLFTRIGEAFIPLGIVPFYGRGDGPEELTPEEEERLNSYLTFYKRFRISESGEVVTIGSSFGLLPENEGGPGVILLPFGQATLFELLGEWGLGLELEAALSGIQVTRDGFSSIEGSSGAGIGASLRLQKLPTENSVAVLIGDIDGTHFSIASFAIDLGFDLFDNRQEFRALTALNGLKLVIKGGEGDGFLNSILSEDGLVLEAGVEVGYSSLTGFHFKGSGGLEIYLPTHISLGPIELQALVIILKIIDRGQISLEMGANVSAELGPLKAVVENLGLKLSLSFPSGGDGNLAVADLAFAFKPPNGVGLAVDAGVVKGGGYLYFDFDREE